MIDLNAHGMLTILSAIGTRYRWGAGNLVTAFTGGPEGLFDCSGFAQWALAQMGLVRQGAWHDINATGLANACDKVASNLAVPGDLAFYGTGTGDRPITHVMVYIGEGMVIGASGGGSKTFGDDPNAVVQVRPVGYRKDLVVIGRLKPEFRP